MKEINRIRQFLLEKRSDYPPFNVIFGKQSQVFYFSSQADDVVQLNRGIHTLANGCLNEDHFKSRRLKALVEKKNSTELLENHATKGLRDIR